MITLLDVLDRQFEELVVDKKLIERIYRFQVEFLNRDAEHLAFFGSNLIGVHVIRWRVADTLKFYREVVDLDYGALEKAIRTVTTIVHEYKISGDVLNLTLMYLIHRIASSGKLVERDRQRGCYDTALVFFYRCIAIRQSDYFHFPADPKVAQAAYAALSNKFLIKQLGSWRAVMEYRAKDLIDPKGLHYKSLVDFTNDQAVTYAISDGENRIRELYKTYYREFDHAHKQGHRIGSSSATQIDLEGVETLKEKVKSTEQYINYIRQAILDPDSFVKPDLVQVIVDINTNTSYRMLSSTLAWLAEHYNDPKWHAKIDQYLKLIVIHSFYLLSQTESASLKDYPGMLLTLKNFYLSTRSNDKELLEIRKLGDGLIQAANGSVNNSLAMATRTATILYITLRAIVVTASR